jgi:hypothetical protein
VSCENWIDETPLREDIIQDEKLVDAADIPLLITGVKANFSSTMENVVMLGDLLGDQFVYGKDIIKDATYSSFDEIERGQILLDNNSVDALADNLGELWKHATLLEDRVTNIITDATDEETNAALYVAKFYEAAAYEIYAGFFGLTENQGGGCIDAGEFKTSQQLYNMAVDTYKEALDYAGEAEAKIVNSLIARCYLYLGNYSNAKSHADNGMKEGDAPFQAQFSIAADNFVWQQGSSALRAQNYVNGRFADYIAAEPTEANRIPIEEVPAGLLVTDDTTTTYYLQTKYYTADAPIPFMTWQENHLMLAELAVRGEGGDAVSLVNAVRMAHGIPEIDAVDEQVIIEERDKELFLTGQRLCDQRRFDGLWHLSADAWHFLPIVARERHNNPNID